MKNEVSPEVFQVFKSWVSGGIFSNLISRLKNMSLIVTGVNVTSWYVARFLQVHTVYLNSARACKVLKWVSVADLGILFKNIAL